MEKAKKEKKRKINGVETHNTYLLAYSGGKNWEESISSIIFSN
jgi:hypothetical protein